MELDGLLDALETQCRQRGLEFEITTRTGTECAWEAQVSLRPPGGQLQAAAGSWAAGGFTDPLSAACAVAGAALDHLRAVVPPRAAGQVPVSLWRHRRPGYRHRPRPPGRHRCDRRHETPRGPVPRRWPHEAVVPLRRPASSAGAPVTRHRTLRKTLRSPARRRRRYRPPAERPQAYKARLLPRAALEAIWGQEVMNTR